MKRLAKHILITIALQLALLVSMVNCNAAKDATVAAHIVECIDANIDLPPEQLIIRCGLENGPAIISLIAGQKALHARAKPCTIVTVDAGPPKGPGI